jgi:hypothetical protein
MVARGSLGERLEDCPALPGQAAGAMLTYGRAVHFPVAMTAWISKPADVMISGLFWFWPNSLLARLL